MDQDTLRNVHHILHSLIGERIAKVAFLLNQNGRLVAHVGASASFSPQARFPDVEDNEPGENVYMTGLQDRYVIGIVFSEDVGMDYVREVVEKWRPQFQRVLAPYLDA